MKLSLMKEGILQALNIPRIKKLRRDPEWQKKESMRQTPGHDDRPDPLRPFLPMPPIRRVYLQWYGEEYNTWHDTEIEIDLLRTRVRECDRWMRTRSEGGSGDGDMAIALISLPALLLASPYLRWKLRKIRKSEEEARMSLHSIALLKELQGKLNPSDETLLRAALVNEWLASRKLEREIPFEAVLGFLKTCTRWNDRWYDAEGDLVAWIRPDFVEGWNFLVLGSVFKMNQAEALMRHFNISDDE